MNWNVYHEAFNSAAYFAGAVSPPPRQDSNVNQIEGLGFADAGGKHARVGSSTITKKGHHCFDTKAYHNPNCRIMGYQNQNGCGIAGYRSQNYGGVGDHGQDYIGKSNDGTNHSEDFG